MRKTLLAGAVAVLGLMAWPTGEAKAQYFSFGFGNGFYGPYNSGFGVYAPGYSPGLSLGYPYGVPTYSSYYGGGLYRPYYGGGYGVYRPYYGGYGYRSGYYGGGYRGGYGHYGRRW